MISKQRMNFCWAAVLLFVTYLVNCTGQEVQAAEPKATGTVVSYDGDKCVRVNGKPFFAVGMYNAWCPDGCGVNNCPGFAKLAANGINLVHSYAWEGQADYDGGAWLDAAQTNGMMGLVGLYRSDVYEIDFARSIARIKKFRNHPAVMGWHVMDEPHWTKVHTECQGRRIDGKPGSKYMPAAYKMIKEHDSNHPVTTVTVNHQQIKQFMPCLDVMQTDYYCIPPIPQTSYFGTGFFGIKRWVEESRAASAGKKPFWFVCEAWDYGVDKVREVKVPKKWQRFPTQREMRTMTYTAVAAGARGVFYYSLNLLMDESKTRGGDREEYLERVLSVTRELKQLQPLLTADTKEIVQDKDSVISMIKSDGQDTYIIMANYERRPTKTVISIPGVKQGTAEVVFGKGIATIVEGKLTCDLEAIESRVYRIKR